jgi:ABC-2 type transport system permease protein
MGREHAVAYVWLGQAFLAMFPLRVDADLAEMMRSGNVAYELLRPVSLFSLWYSRHVAGRIAPTLLRAVPILALSGIMGWVHWPGWPGLAACAASLTAAVLLSSAVAMLMTMSMFWTISGRGISVLISMTAFVLSGMVIPLPLFPDSFQPVLNALPFRGLVDVPFRLFIGHIPAAEAPYLVAHQLAWTAGLVLFGRWALGRAVRRLVVQGG